MKKNLLLVVFTACLLNKLVAQEDSSLVRRVNEILTYTEEKNTGKILDYTYPKLFKVVSRNQMAEALKAMYDTEEFVTELDSLFTVKIHPVFTVEGKQYSRIVHNMVMHMKFKKAVDTADKENEAVFLVELMSEKYGKENVRFDIKKNSLIIKTTPDMIAVKENNTWYFANYDEDNPAMIDLLFSKAVQKKYQEFQ